MATGSPVTSTPSEDSGVVPGPPDYVAVARAQWTARFVAHGVPYGELTPLFDRISAWDEWCAAWSAVAAGYEDRGRAALAADRVATAEQQLAIASICYHFAKFTFVVDQRQMRDAHERAVACAELARPLGRHPGRRIEIPFDGAALPAVLRLPDGAGPHPLVLLVSGIDSTKEEMRALEPDFLARGIATLAFDGPGQGECEYYLPIREDFEVAGSVVLDVAAGLPEIDAARIAVWGVSLGGYYATRIASADRRVAALVNVSGPFDVGRRWPTTPGLTKDILRVRSHSPDDDAARAVAETLTLEGRAAQVACPTLVVAGKLDRLVPWQEQAAVHAQITGSELRVYDDGNHVCANLAAVVRPAAVDWLADVLR